MPARTISQLESTSAILGEYMLKGWTLTDLHCDVCHSTPLMREPTAVAEREGRERIQFCALCDGRPDGASTSTSTPNTSSITSASTVAPAAIAAPVHTYDSPFGPISASSAAPPAQSFNSAQPPAQPTQNNDSHSIAESISSLLLRGHSLLGENCPNNTCKGVPLVGYPRRPDGKKDGRKMCVSCGGRWVDEKYLSTSTSGIGSGMTVVPSTTENTGRKHGNEEGELSPRSKARNELYGLTSTGQNQPPQNKESAKGKERQVNESDRDAFAQQAQQSANELTLAQGDDVDMDLDTDYQPHVKGENLSTSPTSPLAAALSQTSNSLANTLRSLSSSLDRHASHPPMASDAESVSGRWFVDLKLHTEAIKDVLSVVEQVERARRA